MNERDLRLDNIKGMMIVLMVLFHCLVGYDNVPEISFAVRFVYAFHMPVFVFISGYLTKDSSKVPMKSIVFLLVSYVVANSILGFRDLARGGEIDFLKPYYSCWYLLALAWWRLALPFIKDVPGILIASICLSLSVGFVKDVDNTFALARTIAFSPFFLAGFLCRRHGYCGLTVGNELKRRRLIGSTCLVLGFLAVLIGLKAFGVSYNDELMSAYHGALRYDFARRVFLLCCAALIIYGFMCVTPNIELLVFGKLGRNSFSVFALHRLPTLMLLSVLPASTFSAWYVPASLIFGLLLCLVLGSDAVEHAFRGGLTRLSNRLCEAGGASRVTAAAVWGFVLLFVCLCVLNGLIS